MSSSEKEAKELEKQKKDLAKLKAKLEKDAKKSEKRASDLRQARKSGSLPHGVDGDASPISPRSSYVDLFSHPSPAEILAQSSRDAIPPVFEPATVLVPEKISPLTPQKATHPPPDRPTSSPTQTEKRVTLQDFKILKLIGKGGFGEVRRAQIYHISMGNIFIDIFGNVLRTSRALNCSWWTPRPTFWGFFRNTAPDCLVPFLSANFHSVARLCLRARFRPTPTIHSFMSTPNSMFPPIWDRPLRDVFEEKSTFADAPFVV
jgi:hypothetical protein